MRSLLVVCRVVTKEMGEYMINVVLHQWQASGRKIGIIRQVIVSIFKSINETNFSITSYIPLCFLVDEENY